MTHLDPVDVHHCHLPCTITLGSFINMAAKTFRNSTARVHSECLIVTSTDVLGIFTGTRRVEMKALSF